MLPKNWDFHEILTFREMTRRAFLSSRVIQAQGKFDSNMLVKIVGSWVGKNEDFSESVNSFDTGAIFPPSWDQELSRNAFVVFVYAFMNSRLDLWTLGACGVQRSVWEFVSRPRHTKKSDHWTIEVSRTKFRNSGCRLPYDHEKWNQEFLNGPLDTFFLKF